MTIIMTILRLQYHVSGFVVTRSVVSTAVHHAGTGTTALRRRMSDTNINDDDTTTKKTTTTKRRVAVVTGASRGIGRGIALELGGAGFTVYALGRSSRNSDDAPRRREGARRRMPLGLDLTVESAAEAITARGGVGHAVVCDLSQDGVVEEVLGEVWEQEGRLDLLVCSAFTVPDVTGDGDDVGLRGNFWEQGMAMWDTVNGVGLRQVYAACAAAAPFLIDTARPHNRNDDDDHQDGLPPPPLICLISSFGGRSYTFNVAYGVGKAAIDRLATDMAYQLRQYGVATTALYPGLVRTEGNLQMERDGTWAAASGNLDLDQGETPVLSGRAVTTLASLDRPTMTARSGNVEVVAELAQEFGFTDVDGTCPPSIRSLRYLLPNFVFPQIERDGTTKIPTWLRNNVPDVLLPWSVFSSGPPPEQDTR